MAYTYTMNLVFELCVHWETLSKGSKHSKHATAKNYITNINTQLFYFILLFQLGIRRIHMIASGNLYYLTIGFQFPQIQPFTPWAMITLIKYQKECWGLLPKHRMLAFPWTYTGRHQILFQNVMFTSTLLRLRSLTMASRGNWQFRWTVSGIWQNLLDLII